MIFGKKHHLVGLDIGSRTIKVCEVVDTKTGKSLKKLGSMDIAPGIIVEGVVNDSKKGADAIKQLFEAYNIRENNVAISVGGYSAIVEKIFVKSMSEENLQERISIEAEKYIPFDISDVNLDFQILGEDENKKGRMSVLLVAVKKDMLNDYIYMVELAGLNPCVVDIDAFALQNTFETVYGVKEENIALIDIGSSKTSLNILKSGSSVFMRDVLLGCSQINNEIVSKADCSFEESEQIKYGEQEGRVSPNDLAMIINRAVTGWCYEIKRALDFFYSTYSGRDDRIDRIVLSGGGANIEEFRDLLAREISADVETINPFTNLDIDDEVIDSSYLERIAPQAAICMGLSMRRVNDK